MLLPAPKLLDPWRDKIRICSNFRHAVNFHVSPSPRITAWVHSLGAHSLGAGLAFCFLSQPGVRPCFLLPLVVGLPYGRPLRIEFPGAV